MGDFILHQEEKINEFIIRLRVENGWIYKFYESIKNMSIGMFEKRLITVQFVPDLPERINMENKCNSLTPKKPKKLKG